MKFADLRLSAPILRAVATEGYTDATPIQTQAIPPVLDGRDLLGCAQTGTGKTAAFALPILHRLMQVEPGTLSRRRPIRCLVLCPTRELATQIGQSFTAYGQYLPLRNTVVFGGVGQNPQVRAIKHGVDVLVATPGRLLDLMSQGYIDLGHVEILVLDEADRMLDMGFIHDMRRIFAKVPAKRQTLLFSATIPPEIQELAGSLLRDPVTVRVTPQVATVDAVEESVYFVEKRNKPFLLAHLVDTLPMVRAIVFTRTKHGADKVAKHLFKYGIRAEAIHGNKSQNNRQRALENFRDGKTPVLVATDIASRGIDIEGITHVVNYDLTHEPETYVHRIGRTARAGASGTAIAFCDREEVPSLKAIEKLLRRRIPICEDHPDYPSQPEADKAPAPRQRPAGQRPAHQRPSRPALDDRSAEVSAHNRPDRDARRRNDHAPRTHRDDSPGKRPSRDDSPDRPARDRSPEHAPRDNSRQHPARRDSRRRDSGRDSHSPNDRNARRPSRHAPRNGSPRGDTQHESRTPEFANRHSEHRQTADTRAANQERSRPETSPRNSDSPRQAPPRAKAPYTGRVHNHRRRRGGSRVPSGTPRS